jgi:hypothetical protein
MRDNGDATHNILESIDLLPLSLPIIQLEQTVVEGRLLNNVPEQTGSPGPQRTTGGT